MKNFTLPYSGKTKAMDILNILLITFFIGLIFYYLKNTFSDKNVEGMITNDGIAKNDIIIIKLPNRCDMGNDSQRRTCESADIELYNWTKKRSLGYVKGKTYATRGVAKNPRATRRFYNNIKVPIPDGESIALTSYNGSIHKWNCNYNNCNAYLGLDSRSYPNDNGGNRDHRDRFRLHKTKEGNQNYLNIERIASSNFGSDKVMSSTDLRDGNNMYPPFSAGWGLPKRFAYKVLSKSQPKAEKCPDPKTTREYKSLQNKEIQSSKARDRFKNERDYANKKLKKIYDPKSVPGSLNRLNNIPALEKEITELKKKKEELKGKRNEYRSLYDKTLKRIDNPIDGDPSGLLAQIAQLKGNAQTAKSEYEKNAAAAEARRLAELAKKEEEKKAAAVAAQIRIDQEMNETDDALKKAQQAKAEAEVQRRQYMQLRKQLEARISQLNAQQGKSNEELFAALSKINELKQADLIRRAQFSERIKRERADAVADERNLLAKRFRRRLRNRMRRFIRRYLETQERIRQEKIAKQRKRTQELIKLREQSLRQYTMDLHNKQKLEKEEDMLKQVNDSKITILNMKKNNEGTRQDEGVEPSTLGFTSSQPQMIIGQDQNQTKQRITDNRRKQFGVYQSNVYLTVPKGSEKKDEVEIGKKTVGGNIIPSSG